MAEKEEDNKVQFDVPDDEPQPEEASPTEEANDGGAGGDGDGIEVVTAPFSSFRAHNQDVPTVTLPKDHFTLSNPTTTIRYRRSNNAARIIEDTDKQYILEEADNENTGEHEISIRQIHDTSEGIRFLRALYALATAFWTGFFFIFCLQILLFVFLDLAIHSGLTTDDDVEWLAVIGIVFSIFPFVRGLAAGLVLAGVYVMDTARGHTLTRNFALHRFNQIIVEWIYLFFFILLPCLALIVSLFTGTDDFWAYTGLIWFCSVLVFFCIFSANVIFYEIKACFVVMRNMYDTDNDSYIQIIKRALLLRQNTTYGGYKTVTVVSMGKIANAEHTDELDENLEVPDTRHEDLSIRARVTLNPWFLKMNMYEHLETPQKIYTTEDARDIRPFMTRHTWSLEKVFCRPRQSRYVAILAGPGALTRAQMKSSVACSVLGSAAVFFLILALLTYLEAGIAATLFVVAIAVLVALPSFKSTFRLWKVAKGLSILKEKVKEKRVAYEKSMRSMTFSERENSDTAIGPSESEGIYITSERYRLTKPTEWFALAMFGVEFFFLFFWPLVSYFAIGNWTIGLLYFVVAGVTSARYYLNGALVLEETGVIDLKDGKSEKEKWVNESRLDDIVGNVSRGRSRFVWRSILGGFGFVFLALFAGAVHSGQEDTSQGFDVPFTYVSPTLFRYAQADDSLRYPTCALTSDLGLSPLKTMADYTFLAGHAYRGTAASQEELDLYFGGAINVTDREDLVEPIRANTTDSRVSFKLITFPINSRISSPDDESLQFAYLVIRGTVSQWDAMTDAQLWAPAALFQFLRVVLPFGDIWTPVIPWLINAITTVESESLQKISFYQDTVEFVEYIKKNHNFAGIGITGHSLGGGLSIITGAITKTPAVAVSGPNAMLSRLSFRPQIEADDLDRYTFNIVPERDVVPMFDDKAQNYQMIRCQASFADVVDCHSPLRSLCEIASTCGSRGRPVVCECVDWFNYPEPEFIGSEDERISFTEACAQARADRTEATGEEL